ncbi:MAG: hypothetical protein KJ042_05045, partial [Deltaproteobacteria bacterium]|nr:hypothetical protein [Deltaproteobacteria bacterium]
MTDTLTDFLKISPRLFAHAKTLAVAERTRMKPADVAARVMKIWAWAAQENPTGDVSTLWGAARRIGETARILEIAPKSLDKFLAALVEAGFIDVVEDRHEIHDWLDGTGGYLVSRERKREQARERKRGERERRHAPVVRDTRAPVTPSSRVTSAPRSRVHGEREEDGKLSRVTRDENETARGGAHVAPTELARTLLDTLPGLVRLANCGTRLDEQQDEIAALVGPDLVDA